MNIRSIILCSAFTVFAASGGASPAHGAAQPASVVISVDPGNSTVTISHGAQTQLYHVDPFGTVHLNGAESSLKQLAPGMIVSSLSLSDPTTITDIQVSEAAPTAPAGQVRAPVASSIPAAELAELMKKVGNSYWSNSHDWFYLSADGKLVDDWHSNWVGDWTLSDRHTLLMRDTPKTVAGENSPMLFQLNASYTTAGDCARQPVPTAVMAAKVARLNP